MRRTFKYRIYPTREQQERLGQTLNLVREFYNAALSERRDAWDLNRIRVTCFDQIKQVPDVRRLNSDYLTVHGRSLEQTLRQLDRAFSAFFSRLKRGERSGFPRFKGPRHFNSIIYNRTGWRLTGSHLHISLIGDIKLRLSRPVEGTIKEVRLKREGSKWYACIACDDVPANPLPVAQNAIGIDVGIESFATLSDGTQIENWRYYQSSAKALRVAQRRVARRTKGSHRRRKAVTHLRAIHQRIVNQRVDFQHKLSTDLIREYGVIAIEDLNTKGMARGILSKQILDASWGSFFDKLAYKAESAGRELIAVDPRYTSQTCTCGATVNKSLAVRWHNCPSCGLSAHRDIVSAQIILKRGLGLSLQALTWADTPCVA